MTLTAPFRGTPRYQLVRELGVGGMGIVYEAIDRERGDRRVALKVLQGHDADSLVRLKREFRSLHDVRHRNLVALYELTCDDDTWFFTLELIDGVDFFSWVRPTSQLAKAEAVTADLGATVRSPSASPMMDVAKVQDAFRQLAEGVAFLHSRDRIHRDLKPSNVLVTAEGRVVILDFGLVAELGGPKSLSEEQGRAIVGTVAYMAPEQAASGPIGPKCDWYAVGVMLFQALTGRLPFEGPPVDVMLDKQRRPAPRAREVNVAVPEHLDALCARLLATSPSERPDASEVSKALGLAAPAPATNTTLVGRERELARLEDAFQRTTRSGPRIVRIEGAPGIGKTALLRAFAQRAEQLGALVLAGRCHERETVPFKAVDPVIDALARTLAALPAERVEGLRPRDASLLTKMFPVLNRVPAFRDAKPREVEEPLERRRRAIGALRELFERLSDRAPLVVLVDDAQWGDADSVALMEALLQPPEPPAVLVVTSIRDDGTVLPTPSVPQEALELGPLAPTVCRTLLAGRSLAEGRLDALVHEAAGNPLLLFELLESGGEGEVSAEALWRRKASTLPVDTRRALEAIAIAAGPIEGAVALEAAGVGLAQLDTVAQLEAAHLVRLLPDERRVECWHERLRQTVLSTIEADRQRLLHEQLAFALERSEGDLEAIAQHHAAAGHGERAASATLRAANRARDQLAFSRAAASYRRALELLPADDVRRFEVSVALGESLANAGQGKEAASIYRRALSEPKVIAELAEDLPRRAAEQLLTSGHVDEGLSAIAEVLRGLDMTLAKTPRRAVGALLFRRAHLALRGLSFDERTAAEVSPALLRRIDACWAVSVGMSMVDTIRGASFQTRQLLLALDAGEPWRIARAIAAEAAFLATDGRRAEKKAKALIEQARVLCERVGDARLEGLLAFCEGLTRFLVGDFREAKSRVADAEVVLREAGLGVSWEAATARLFAVWSLFYLGEIGALSKRIPALLRDAEARGDRYAVTSLTVGLANVHLLAEGQPELARQAVQRAMAAWPSKAFHFQHYWAALSEGLIGLYEGKPAPALARLDAVWPELERTMLLRIQNVRVEAISLRARLAFAAGDLARAKSSAQQLLTEGVGWARAQGLALEALLSKTHAQPRLSDAIALFDESGMRLFGAATRLRLSELQGPELGAANARAARAWFETQDVREPDRFARMLVPEFTTSR